MRLSNPSNSGERGIVLLLAMIVLTLLGVIITQISVASSHNKNVSENFINDLQLSYTLKSGYEHGLLLLINDCESSPNLDSLNERWAAPFKLEFSGTDLELQIVDESSKFNISTLIGSDGKVNNLLKDQLTRLFNILRHDVQIVDKMVEYLKMNKLRTLEDLLNTEGLTQEIFYGFVNEEEKKKGVVEFITMWPRYDQVAALNLDDYKINVNTAPAEVLWALSDYMSEAMAQNIVNYRESTIDNKFMHFQNIGEVRKVEGMNDQLYSDISRFIKVKSSLYSFVTKAKAGRMEKEFIYIVRKDVSKKTAHFVTSFRLSRHTSIKPKSE